MKLYINFFIVILILASNTVAGDLLAAGSPAPDFKLPDANGQFHSLSDYKGNIVVLYFYPKDDTPGCTKEACNLRDNYKILQDNGIVILGVSYDNAESHQKFIAKHQLPFTLLSDTNKKVADLYGAKGGILGFIGAKRITYLIDKKGNIMHVFDNVDTGSHAEQILAFLKEQQPGKPGEMKKDTSTVE